MNRTIKIIYFFITIGLTLTAVPLLANSSRPVIPAVQVSEPPQIDGSITDACWQEAPSVTEFYMREDNSKARESAKVWLCYDQINIYVAFYCWDSQPDKIVANVSKHGDDISREDWVGVNIDCFSTCESNIWVDVSAGGAQTDSLTSGGVSNIRWRGDWTAASKMVEDGYTVEIAIPFSILQYNADQTNMGIAFIRRHARYDQWWWSPNAGAPLDRRKFYLWEGLQLPKIIAKPILLAYTTLGADDNTVQNSVGLDAKYAITQNLMGTLTFNPDFRNVEQQVNSIDYTYTERWQSDSRPFFQEGRRYFPGDDLFYSRRIGEMSHGGKLSGRSGPYNLGIMYGSESDGSDFSVTRISREWAGQGGLCLDMVSDGFDEDNTTVGLSSEYRLIDMENRNFDLYYSTNRMTGPGGRQMSTIALSSYSGFKSLEGEIQYQLIDADYDPTLGYVPEKGIKSWTCNLYYCDNPLTRTIKSWDIGFEGARVDYTSGGLYYNQAKLHGGGWWQNGLGTFMSYMISDRPPYHNRRTSLTCYWNKDDCYKNGRITYSFGTLSGGDYKYLILEQGWNFGPKMSIYGSYEQSSISAPSPDEYSDHQLVTTMAYCISKDQSIIGRLVSHGDKNNLYLTYRRRARSGFDTYVIFGDPNAETSRDMLTVKLTRVL